ncbi:MAG: ACP S-malonyltransferase [Bacteriovoracaceae bacterium]|nr:ACP S-malonyltransferase [Bacteriovoracaceae bacterium]
MGVTLVFPGQGSQYVGMGSTFKTDPAFDYFNLADKALGFSISQLCLEGPEDKLKLTEFTQPAIVTHSVAMFEMLKPKLQAMGVSIDRVLGHSVGEYAALVAAGALNFEDAVKAVNLRGKSMQEAVPVGAGKMIAILKIGQDWVEKACQAASTHNESVMPANFNDPKQIVISGHAAACDRAVAWLAENCPEKHGAIPLNVSAPFHSTLMQPAAVVMEKYLNSIQLHPTHASYIANIDAKMYPAGSDSQGIKKRLVDQVCGSVRWTQSIESLPAGTKYIEVGPGKVLAGLIKRIQPESTCLSLDTAGAFEKLPEFLA